MVSNDAMNVVANSNNGRQRQFVLIIYIYIYMKIKWIKKSDNLRAVQDIVINFFCESIIVVTKNGKIKYRITNNYHNE